MVPSFGAASWARPAIACPPSPLAATCCSGWPTKRPIWRCRSDGACFFPWPAPWPISFSPWAAYGVLYFLTAGEHTLTGALTQPVRWTATTLLAIATAIPELFRHSENVSSFVGIVAEGGRFVGVSVARFFLLGAHLSLSLAVFNLLPLPPLDGGKIVFDALCRISRRLSRVYLPSAVCGWVALASLMLYATVQDVWKYLL
ncbi:MAG: site-2 protease family protein [Solidesulfovibrio sp.]